MPEAVPGKPVPMTERVDRTTAHMATVAIPNAITGAGDPVGPRTRRWFARVHNEGVGGALPWSVSCP